MSAGVAKVLLGKQALSDDVPFVTGAIGLLGTKPSTKLMGGCDTLLMIGTRFPWAEFLPTDGRARAMHIDIVARCWACATRSRSIFKATRVRLGVCSCRS